MTPLQQLNCKWKTRAKTRPKTKMKQKKRNTNTQPKPTPPELVTHLLLKPSSETKKSPCLTFTLQHSRPSHPRSGLHKEMPKQIPPCRWDSSPHPFLWGISHRNRNISFPTLKNGMFVPDSLVNITTNHMQTKTRDRFYHGCVDDTQVLSKCNNCNIFLCATKKYPPCTATKNNLLYRKKKKVQLSTRLFELR